MNNDFQKNRSPLAFYIVLAIGTVMFALAVIGLISLL